MYFHYKLFYLIFYLVYVFVVICLNKIYFLCKSKVSSTKRILINFIDK